MNFKQTSDYSAASECARYHITWGDVVPPYHAHWKPTQRDVYGANLGKHESRATAKAACVAHNEGVK